MYVELEATPLIWRLRDDFSVKDHLGRPATLLNCLMDEHGHLYLHTNTGFGRVHTMDMHTAAEAIEQGLWAVSDVKAADLPTRFAYVASPQLLHKK